MAYHAALVSNQPSKDGNFPDRVQQPQCVILRQAASCKSYPMCALRATERCSMTSLVGVYHHMQ